MEDPLNAIGPLREAGFALHWLHPRSKRPIGDEWQKAPVSSVEDLRSTYRAGNNVGVRLGERSHLPGVGYWHVLDMDIRLPELAEEAWEAARALFPSTDLDSLPCVQSGSGGESRHLYLLTDKPFWGKKLATSEGKHRRFDKDRGKEVWSYDWEIELFGTNRHVAIPPSIHPDTGQPYVWLRPVPFDLLPLGLGPIIPSSTIEALAVAETATFEFETREPLTFAPGQLERDLDELPIAHLDDYHDWVTLGMALHHQFGGSDEGWDLWIKHSQRSEQFNPAKLREYRSKWRGFGKNRRQPVTMGTVRQWAIDARQARLIAEFDDLPDRGDAFDSAGGTDDDDEPSGGDFDDLEADDDEDDEGRGDLAELLGIAPGAAGGDPLANFDTEALTLDWLSLLDFNEEGGLRPTLHNAKLIVSHDPRLAGVPQLNEFTQEIMQRRTPAAKESRRRNAAKPTLQLDGRIWEVKDPLNGVLWSEDRDFAIRAIIEAPKTQGGYGMKVSDRDLKGAVSLAAHLNPFHPVREYLESVEWDGKPRIETLFIDYVGSPDTTYSREVARNLMVAAVTRIFEPGHKYDFAVILEGLQGKRKSTFIEVLGRRWFAELDGDFHDPKQMVELMQGAWIMEIPELSGFGRADVRSIKAFISRRKDRVRLAYARRAGEYPRQCVFIGSTNDREYLKDDTGGRRFWPMPCTVSEIDTLRLEAEVDQLWAEAVTLYRAMRAEQPKGTLPLYLQDPESRALALQLQESRRVESADDALVGQISAWLDKPINTGGIEDDPSVRRYRTETCLIEIWCDCLGRERGHYANNQGAAQSLGRAMRGLASTWTSDGGYMSHPTYGRQRAYRRIDRFDVIG